MQHSRLMINKIIQVTSIFYLQTQSNRLSGDQLPYCDTQITHYIFLCVFDDWNKSSPLPPSYHLQQLIIRIPMGNLIANNEISISIEKPTSKLFDFHKANSSIPKQPLSYPSFIKQSQLNAIQYAQRCKFADREYEIDYKQLEDGHEIVFRKQLGTNTTIWRALTPGQRVTLLEGSVIRMAEQEFVIKKICQSFSDIDGLHDHLRTLSDIDLADNINLANSCLQIHQSPQLKRSKMLPKMDSVSSINLDQEGQFCRVCFGRQGGERNPLLSLCKCAGSVKNIHYLCLKRWINTKSKHASTGTYQYYEYDLSCDLCKQKIDKVIHHKGKKYAVYSQSLLHPPYVVMAYRSDQSNLVREFIINFDHQNSITIGKSKDCDLPLQQRFISGQHCELNYEKNTLYLKNLNPAFGTFVNFTEADITSNENSISLMVNNHLIKLQNESYHCFTYDLLKVRLEDPERETD